MNSEVARSGLAIIKEREQKPHSDQCEDHGILDRRSDTPTNLAVWSAAARQLAQT
jgi:hypothetical protein